MNWFNGDYTTASGDKMSSGMNLMGSLMEGFRSIGQQAGGFTDGSAPTNDIIDIACKDGKDLIHLSVFVSSYLFGYLRVDIKGNLFI